MKAPGACAEMNRDWGERHVYVNKYSAFRKININRERATKGISGKLSRVSASSTTGIDLMYEPANRSVGTHGGSYTPCLP